MKLTVEVKDDTIANLLTDAGRHIAYWASEADRKDTFVLYVQEREEGSGDPREWHRVGVRRALETMATRQPKRFAGLLSGDYDGDTCDLFVQYGCFGKAVSG